MAQFKINFLQNNKTISSLFAKKIIFYVVANEATNIIEMRLKQRDSLLVNELILILVINEDKTRNYLIIENGFIVKNNDEFLITSTNYIDTSNNQNLINFVNKNKKAIKYNYKFYKKKSLVGLTLKESIEMNLNSYELKKIKLLEFLERETKVKKG